MSTPQRNKALILTERIITGHQIASILQLHGWSATNIHNSMSMLDIIELRPGMLVLDLTGPSQDNLQLLADYRCNGPMAYIVALCKGGNTPAMRSARSADVDGYFYLNSSGMALDASRGLAALFLDSRTPAMQRNMRPGFFGNSPQPPVRMSGSH